MLKMRLLGLSEATSDKTSLGSTLNLNVHEFHIKQSRVVTTLQTLRLDFQGYFRPLVK